MNEDTRCSPRRREVGGQKNHNCGEHLSTIAYAFIYARAVLSCYEVRRFSSEGKRGPLVRAPNSRTSAALASFANSDRPWNSEEQLVVPFSKINTRSIARVSSTCDKKWRTCTLCLDRIMSISSTLDRPQYATNGSPKVVPLQRSTISMYCGG